MTPRRLDPETVHRRLRHMRDLLAELSDLGAVDEQTLRTDYRNRDGHVPPGNARWAGT